MEEVQISANVGGNRKTMLESKDQVQKAHHIPVVVEVPPPPPPPPPTETELIDHQMPKISIIAIVFFFPLCILGMMLMFVLPLYALYRSFFTMEEDEEDEKELPQSSSSGYKYNPPLLVKPSPQEEEEVILKNHQKFSFSLICETVVEGVVHVFMTILGWILMAVTVQLVTFFLNVLHIPPKFPKYLALLYGMLACLSIAKSPVLKYYRTVFRRRSDQIIEG